jgi:hypothetical protein
MLVMQMMRLKWLSVTVKVIFTENFYTVARMKSESQVSETMSWQFAYLGFACLLGWNVVLYVAMTLQADIIFTTYFNDWMSFFYGLAMSLTILPLVFVGNNIPKSPRACIGGAAMFASLGLIGLSGFINPASAPFGLALVALLAVGTSSVQGFYFSEAATHSQNAIAKFSIGQAVSGLICLPISLILQQIFSNPAHVMAAFCFIAAIACAGSIPVYIFSVRKHLAMKEASSSLDQHTMSEQPIRGYMAIIKDIWPMTLSIFVNFVLLFLVFPVHVIMNWNPTSTLFPGAYTFLTIAFFAYNLADCIGRYLVSFGVTLNKVGVVAVTAARLVPLALWYLSSFSSIAFMTNDYFRIFVMVVFTIISFVDADARTLVSTLKRSYALPPFEAPATNDLDFSEGDRQMMSTKKPAGRPLTKRHRKGRREHEDGKFRSVTCTLCGKKGHNKSSCEFGKPLEVDQRRAQNPNKRRRSA